MSKLDASCYQIGPQIGTRSIQKSLMWKTLWISCVNVTRVLYILCIHLKMQDIKKEARLWREHGKRMRSFAAWWLLVLVAPIGEQNNRIAKTVSRLYFRLAEVST